MNENLALTSVHVPNTLFLHPLPMNERGDMKPPKLAIVLQDPLPINEAPAPFCIVLKLPAPIKAVEGHPREILPHIVLLLPPTITEQGADAVLLHPPPIKLKLPKIIRSGLHNLLLQPPPITEQRLFIVLLHPPPIIEP